MHLLIQLGKVLELKKEVDEMAGHSQTCPGWTLLISDNATHYLAVQT